MDYQTSRRLQDDSAAVSCSLCYDGESLPDPLLESPLLPGSTCGEIKMSIESITDLSRTECIVYQIFGTTECGCPTSPLAEGFCSLCDGNSNGSYIIPKESLILPIPVTATQPMPDLTCADLIFQQQSNAKVPCDQVGTYRRYCGCETVSVPATASVDRNTTQAVPALLQDLPPSTSNNNSSSVSRDIPTYAPILSRDAEFTCNVCPDKSIPQFRDRILPFLTAAKTPQSNSIPSNPQNPDVIITCGELSEAAQSNIMDTEECYNAIFPPVALDVPSFCGCNGASESDKCSLCPAGIALVNPSLNVPGAGGLSCLEVDNYLRFVTDEASCMVIAESARSVCCTPAPDCHICSNPAVPYNRDKLYPPYGLTCSQLNLLLNPSLWFNNELTCQAIQDRFGFYCECDNAVKPNCSLCPMDDQPPDPTLTIPVLGPGITCGEINDYASLRTQDTCTEEMAGWGVDVRAFCGCPGFEARGNCILECPDSLVIKRDSLVPDNDGDDRLGMSIAAFLTCGEMVDFAPFVDSSTLCSAMQDSLRVCCVETGSVAVSLVAPDAADREQRNFRDNEVLVSYPFIGDTTEANQTTDDEFAESIPFLDPNPNSDVYERKQIFSPYYYGAHVQSSAPVAIAGAGGAVSLLIAGFWQMAIIFV